MLEDDDIVFFGPAQEEQAVGRVEVSRVLGALLATACVPADVRVRTASYTALDE